jgi:transposase-like protein
MHNRTLFTPAVFEQLPGWVQDGLSVDEISQQIGCTVGTLRVRCSQQGISLSRRPRSKPLRVPPASQRLPRMTVPLPDSIIAILEQRADGKGVTGRKLAATLLETIVKDDLFEAVLDGELA